MFQKYEDIRGKSSKEILETQFELLRGHYKNASNLKRILLFTGVAFLIVAPVIYIFFGLSTKIACLLLIYGLLSLIASYFIPTREIEREMKDIENQVDYLKIAETSAQERAEKKFRLHSIELKKYYDLTLKHSTWIFFVGIACIFLGFVIIGGTIYIIASDSMVNDNRAQVILGVLGGIGGFLSNFVAAIYLKMYAQTIGSLAELHNRLVITHHLHFANFIASKITDKALLNKTLAEFTLQLTKK